MSTKTEHKKNRTKLDTQIINTKKYLM